MSQLTFESTTDLKAYQVMSHPLFTASPDDSIHEIAEMFVEYNISGAPIVNGERALGVITKTDLARFEKHRTAGEEAEESAEDRAGENQGVRDEEKVTRWMTPTVFSVPPNASLTEVCREMIRNGVHHIFVRDDASPRLLGVITSFDLLKVLADFLHRSGR